MSVRAFGPAPHINVDEIARRLRAPSSLPRISESSSRLSECAPNTPERGGTGKESIEPPDLRSPPQLHLKPGGGASIVDADDSRTVDDLRRWWQQRLPQGAAQDHSRRQKLTRMAIAIAGIALISSAIAPTLLKRPPVAPRLSLTILAGRRQPERRQTSALCRRLESQQRRRSRLRSTLKLWRGSPPRRRRK